MKNWHIMFIRFAAIAAEVFFEKKFVLHSSKIITLFIIRLSVEDSKL